MALVIVGGAMQIAGFVLVGWELARIQRREFGEPEIVSRWRSRIRRWTGRTKTVTARATLSIKTGMHARGKVRTPPGETLGDRVMALEKNLGRIEQELDDERAASEQGRAELLDLIDMTRGEFRHQRLAEDEDRKAFLRTSVALQSWGTLFFTFGTILGVVGSVGA